MRINVTECIKCPICMQGRIQQQGDTVIGYCSKCGKKFMIMSTTDMLKILGNMTPVDVSHCKIEMQMFDELEKGGEDNGTDNG